MKAARAMTPRHSQAEFQIEGSREAGLKHAANVRLSLEAIDEHLKGLGIDASDIASNAEEILLNHQDYPLDLWALEPFPEIPTPDEENSLSIRMAHGDYTDSVLWVWGVKAGLCTTQSESNQYFLREIFTDDEFMRIGGKPSLPTGIDNTAELPAIHLEIN